MTIAIETYFTGNQLCSSLLNDEEETFYFFKELIDTNPTSIVENIENYVDTSDLSELADWMEKFSHALRSATNR